MATAPKPTGFAGALPCRPIRVVRGCRVALSAGSVLFLLPLGACGKATAAAENPKLAKALADPNAAGKVVFVTALER